MKTMKAFFRDDCPFSKQMSVDFYEFVNENKNIPLEIIYITEETRKIAADAMVFNVPTIVIYKDNKEYCRTVGARTKQNLIDFWNYEYSE